MSVYVCCEHTLENCGFVCVMLVNAQLQHKAIKRSISGHVKIRFGSLFGKINK